jgi:hypothetical protein
VAQLERVQDFVSSMLAGIFPLFMYHAATDKVKA